MALNKIRLGDYIERSTVNNSNLRYGIELIEGVTNEGVFAPPKGNPMDVDLKPYKIVYPGAFVYNPSRLDLGSIAYRTGEMCIVSHLYIVFYLNEEGKKIIDPDYLFMYFRRKEFYREVTFRNFGSQRPEFIFNDMSDLEIPLPDITVQRKFVNIYKTMVANQQSYECGLEDLKTVFTGYIENLRRGGLLRRIGEYIVPYNEKNREGAITLEQGINIDKKFITPQRSNSDLHGRKIVRHGQFAYCTQLNNANVAIAYREGCDCVVSSVYDVFEISRKSNFHIVIVVDMWITGFDVPTLTYLYNDKPLQKHLLIQTISRVNRKYPGKEYGMVIDFIGIRRNMRQAMKLYGGDSSVAPTQDDVEQATQVFREQLAILKDLFAGFDLNPFLNPNGNPVERYTLLARAAEYVFISTQELNVERNGGKTVKRVSFQKYFLTNVKRMRAAYDICQPSGELGEEESSLAQCFMAIAGFVRKMSGTSDVDTDSMNRHVARMVEEALSYSKVESILDEGEEEDLFSPEFTEKLSDVRLPASKLEILVKLLRKQITDYSKTNQVAAKKYQEMLEATIREYHERRKHLTEKEAGEAQEVTSEEIIRNATEQALRILREMNADRESFRKIGLTFEEKAFYDILMALRDEYNFEYGEDRNVNGVSVNDKCKSLAKKIKEIIDTKSSFADWLNNQIVRDQLKFDIKVCLIKNGYPPQYSPEVFRKVMEQVENFEENN